MWSRDISDLATGILNAFARLGHEVVLSGTFRTRKPNIDVTVKGFLKRGFARNGNE